MSFKRIFIKLWLSIIALEVVLVGLTFWELSSANEQQVRVLQNQSLDHIFQIEESRLVGNLLIKNERVLLEQLERIALSNKIGVAFEGDRFRFFRASDEQSERLVRRSYPVIYAGDSLGTLHMSANASSRLFPQTRGLVIVLIGQILVALVAMFLFRRTSRYALVNPVASIGESISMERPALASLPNNTPKELIRLAETLDGIRLQLRQEQELRIEQDRQVALGNLAAQVSHDIRSPLAALRVVSRDLSELPEEKRVLLRSAVNRINDIANNLLPRRFDPSPDSPQGEPHSVQLLPGVLDLLVTEKRLQYRSKIGIQIDATFDSKSYGLFAKIQLASLKRVVSNLINNAVEAIGDLGQVNLSLDGNHERILITVADNGKGIPAEVIPHLMQRGATFGKAGGSGLGLFHAKSTIETWGGDIRVDSEIGEGTSVNISLPRAKAPEWFVDKLRIRKNSTIVVLDDDNSIHQIWLGKIEPLRPERYGVSIVHFSDLSGVRSWFKANPPNVVESLFLIDYELVGPLGTGLDLIESLNIRSRSVLVTSRFEERAIRERCERLGVKLIPKGMAGSVPIEMGTGEQRPTMVLLDDDPLVRQIWDASAKARGIDLRSFDRVEDFLSAVSDCDPSTPLYIDESLGKGVSGLTIARKLHERGYERLFLATGHPASTFAENLWLEGIVGKEPPIFS